MDEKRLKALATELTKGLKTEADLNAFSRMLTKLTVETALNAELTDHLGHEKNAPKKALIPAQVNIGGDVLPWANQTAFAELMLSWEMRSWYEAEGQT